MCSAGDHFWDLSNLTTHHPPWKQMVSSFGSGREVIEKEIFEELQLTKQEVLSGPLQQQHQIPIPDSPDEHYLRLGTHPVVKGTRSSLAAESSFSLPDLSFRLPTPMTQPNQQTQTDALALQSFDNSNNKNNLLRHHQQQEAAVTLALAAQQKQYHQAASGGDPVNRHNLIPAHLQAAALAPSLNGTPGYPSALIPPPGLAGVSPGAIVTAAATAGIPVPNGIPLTVQDRPMAQPVYNGVNPNYPGLRVLNNSPPMFCVENFLTPFETEFLIQVAQDSFGPAPVVGKGVGEISPSRTSSTCYLAREDVPDVMRKVSILTGKPIDHCELPQVGRYFPTQQYLQHFDAFDLSTEDGCRFAANGGQRTITVLIYLNDVMRGGATRFPALNLEVQPQRGMALVFFPATVDGMLDKMALHAALPAIDTKYVSQCWIRQSTYNGQPSKRLPATLGTPFGQENNPAFLNQQQQYQQQHQLNQQQQQQHLLSQQQQQHLLNQQQQQHLLNQQQQHQLNQQQQHHQLNQQQQHQLNQQQHQLSQQQQHHHLQLLSATAFGGLPQQQQPPF